MLCMGIQIWSQIRCTCSFLWHLISSSYLFQIFVTLINNSTAGITQFLKEILSVFFFFFIRRYLKQTRAALHYNLIYICEMDGVYLSYILRRKFLYLATNWLSYNINQSLFNVFRNACILLFTNRNCQKTHLINGFCFSNTSKVLVL